MASLQDIRSQYPQYNSMSDQELADKLHAKYYSDMPKTDFYSKVGLNANNAPAAPAQPPSKSIPDQIGDAVAGTIKAVPGALLGGAENLYGVGKGLLTQPGQTTSDILGGIGSAAYHLPGNVAQAFGKNIYGQYYPNYQWSRPDDPGTKFGEFAFNALPVGRGAKIAESAVAAGLGKNLLSKGLGLAAGGAVTSPIMGVNPLQGAVSNTLLGGLGGITGGIANRVNKYADLYRNVAPELQSNLPNIPKQIYGQIANKYVGLKNQASDVYKGIDNDPRVAQGIPTDTNTFFDTVKNQVNKLENGAQTANKKDQLEWVKSFLPKEGMQLNNFQDFKNIDQQLNDVYKSENVQNNPGLKGQYGILKQALNQHADEMGDALPQDLKDQYAQAKNLWQQKSAIERLPNSTEASPFYRQFMKETDPQGVASGKTDANGYLIGNPGNFLSNYFKPSSALSDQSARINHLTSLLPDQTGSIRSAYLNPNALQNVPFDKLAKQFNSLNPDSQKMLFGDQTPLANSLQAIANRPKVSGLSKFADKVLGYGIGSEVGHPILGLGLGMMLPNLFRAAHAAAPQEQNSLLQYLRNNIPSTTARRQYAYLPAAYNNQNQ
jgi:hypothetical protein